MRIIIGCVLAALAVGCASTEPVKSESPVAKEVKIDSTNIAEAQAAGYQVVDKGGHKLFCRKELQTGSHVRYKTSCMSEQEWAQLAQSSRESVQSMARRVQPPRGN
jgi:hypothetical protein